jgi:glycosyltransferase involved in cell wall biosynthesis
MNRIKLTHFFTFYNRLGGVESLLKRHLASDSNWGLDSDLVAFFESALKDSPKTSGVGLTWRDSVLSARSGTRRCMEGKAPEVAVYHNFWGLPFLGDLDRASRRIALLHSGWPGMKHTLEAQRGLVDGVLCVSDVLERQVREWMPELPAERVKILPYPIADSPCKTVHAPLAGRPMVLGFSGRVVKAQKRIDRLPRLIAMLDRAGLDYRFEILGEGADQAWLHRRLGGNPRVRMHGRKSGDEYWKTLGGWDVILFTSDYEGLPISMLEAFSLGILPVYPRIDSGGDGYTTRVRPDLLYAPDDFEHVAEVLKSLHSAPRETIDELRERARGLARAHQGDAYLRVFSEFTRQIVDLPRISASEFPVRPFYWSDCLPFGVMRRLFYRGFYRRNDGGFSGS